MADNALDKANAMAELNSSSEKENIADLESKYGSSSSASVDDELAALKASLGK